MFQSHDGIHLVGNGQLSNVAFWIFYRRPYNNQLFLAVAFMYFWFFIWHVTPLHVFDEITASIGLKLVDMGIGVECGRRLPFHSDLQTNFMFHQSETCMVCKATKSVCNVISQQKIVRKKSKLK